MKPELLQLGSELFLRMGWAGVSSVRRDDHGHILIGQFTDRLREYATDYTMEQVINILNVHEARKAQEEYKRGFEEGKKSRDGN